MTSSLAFLVPNKSYEGTFYEGPYLVPSYLRMKVTFEAKVFHLRYDMYDIISRLDFFRPKIRTSILQKVTPPTPIHILLVRIPCITSFADDKSRHRHPMYEKP